MRSDASEGSILSRVHQVYRKVADLTVQVEKDPSLTWLTGGAAGSGAGAVDGGGGGGGGGGDGFRVAIASDAGPR